MAVFSFNRSLRSWILPKDKQRQSSSINCSIICSPLISNLNERQPLRKIRFNYIFLVGSTQLTAKLIKFQAYLLFMLSRLVNSYEYLDGESCMNLVSQHACERVPSISYPQALLLLSPFYHLFFLIFPTTTYRQVWRWSLFVYFISSHCERPALLSDPFHILHPLYYTFCFEAPAICVLPSE